jgi:small GTP-binding protein
MQSCSPEIKKIKCVLVGDSGVGKTSLANRLYRNVFFEFEEATIGASFLSVEKYGVSLDMWDTAGQERYNALLPMYTRNARIAYVVVSANEKKIDEKFEDWARRVHHTSPNCYIIRIVSQIDKYPGEGESTSAMFWTSAKTGEGCENILSKTIVIAKELKEDEEVLDRVPLHLCTHRHRAARGDSGSNCYGGCY